MEDRQICQVKGCNWPVLLCPELCAPHWWKLPFYLRQQITRAQVKGQQAGNHPSLVYKDAILAAIGILNASQGTLAVYVRELGDRDGKHTAFTTCPTCQRPTVHHTVIRTPDTLLVCSECQSITPTILPGAQTLPGMEGSP